MDCIFCKIISGEIPSYTIYEDEIVKCFLDNNPNANGHLLIVPKKHYVNLEDIPVDTLNYINKISKDMYDLLKEKLGFIGLRVVQNNGIFQEVKHYHMHLVPAYKDKDLLPIEKVYEILKK
ncbi:MAG TPA: HIT domain-containing protein [Bacilli bacterium]|nr:HIT domain-containing protein [Bacilli bacterium]